MTAKLRTSAGPDEAGAVVGSEGRQEAVVRLLRLHHAGTAVPRVDAEADSARWIGDREGGGASGGGGEPDGEDGEERAKTEGGVGLVLPRSGRGAGSLSDEM